MKIPIYDPFTKSIVGTKKVEKMVDPNEEVIHLLRKRYTYIQVNGGRSTWESVKDLQDHSKKKLSGSTKRYQNLYGPEWKEISRNAREAVGYRCQECDREFSPIDLHVHHIRSIRQFVSMGATWTEEHECHGVKTKRPYHVEENLEVLCKEHHGDRHGRTFR